MRQAPRVGASSAKKSTWCFRSPICLPWRARSASPVTLKTRSRFTAIRFYVNQINEAGGINGRTINPIIVSFDPANNANMQSLCQQWTQGNPAVFAVVDGIGTWTGDNQLCVTQQGHTPLISAWSTTTNWTQLGSPYLWWTGPDQAPVLAATVQWGLSSGRLGHGKKVGVVVSDQAGDQAALNSYLLPDLKKAGITPQVATVAGNPDESAATSSDAQLAVERFKAAGVQSVIPLLPENAFFPYLSAENLAAVLPAAAAERLRIDDRDWSRSDPDSLRKSAQWPRRCHRGDARGHRRRSSPEPRRL